VSVRRPSPAVVVEATVAFGLAAWLLTRTGFRALWLSELGAFVGGARAAAALFMIDRGTLAPILASVLKIALLAAPPLRLLVRARRRHLVWLPLGLVFFPELFGIAVPGVVGVTQWILFSVAALLAWLAVARPRLRALAFLPWLIALEPLLGHSPLSDTAWSGERLARRCAGNDGSRPIDFRPELAGTRYYSVTPLSSRQLLLVGERRAFWVDRADDGAMHLGPPFALSGNFWQGCLRDGKVWLTARDRLCEVEPPASPPTAPTYHCHPVPEPPGTGIELDFTDPICPSDVPGFYLGQLVRGGFIEFEPGSREQRWHAVLPGLNLQLVPRRDGRLVGITTTRLLVFDPHEDHLVDEQAAGLVAMGVDLCAHDDSIAVTDFTGRVRLFDRTAAGGYRFRAAVDLPAPRRVAFSPSCDTLAVTSGDDRHAYLLRTRTLERLRTWKLGPGLRDLTFLDEHHVGAVDACTLNVLDVPQP
jgi:hypothetical protein